MLRTANPVLSHPEKWSGQDQTQVQQQGYNGYGQQGGSGHPAPPEERMTLDDVVTKTIITMGVMVIVAVATFLFMPESLIGPAWIGGILATLGLGFVINMQRRVNPVLVIIFSVIEGVFVGAVSKYFEGLYDGIVVQAVLATLVATALTLAAYKIFNIQVTAKFRKVVVISTLALFVVYLVNFAVSLFGVNTPLIEWGSGAGLLSMAVSAIAVVLAVLNLILDFDHVETGIKMGAPANESWRAAFGLMVTVVWLYIELLRILSYFRN